MIIDWIIISVIVLSVAISWRRGATREIFSLISWSCSGILAILLFPYGRNIIRNFVYQPLLVDLITSIVLFFLFLIILNLLSYLLSYFVKSSALNMSDKICGSLFGAIRGMCILAVIDFGFVNFLLPNNSKVLQRSSLQPYVHHISHILFLTLPNTTQRNILNHLNPNQQKVLLSQFKDKINLGEKTEGTAISNNITKNIGHRTSINSHRHHEQSSQTAEELSTLKVRKLENNKEDDMNKTRIELEKLLDRIG